METLDLIESIIKLLIYGAFGAKSAHIVFFKAKIKSLNELFIWIGILILATAS